MNRYPRAQWRLLLSHPADGPTNMAVDEAIMHGIAEGQSPPTLRFFAWTPPCLSLGYTQPAADADSGRIAALGYGLVRRPTGGRAILHTDELTYSINAPQSDPRVAGGVLESYRRLSEGLMRGLQLLGAPARNDSTAGSRPTESRADNNPVCFVTPSHYEIAAHGKKLIGSAQARKRGVVLQHGSLPLTGDMTRICDALRYADERQRAAAKKRLRARAATLEQAIGRAVSWSEAAEAMTQGFAETLELDLIPAPLTEAELARASELRSIKYAAVV